MNLLLRLGAAIAILAIGVAAVGFLMTKVEPDVAKLLPGLIGAAAVLVGVLIIFLSARGTSITVAQIPTVLSKLQNYGSNPAYALFTFKPHDSDDEISFQFSMEGNVAGLDWFHSIQERGEVAYARNEADLPQFIEFARKLGYEVTEKAADRVRYVRIERGGPLPELATRLLQELYGLGPRDRIKLEVQGFTWKS